MSESTIRLGGDALEFVRYVASADDAGMREQDEPWHFRTDIIPSCLAWGFLRREGDRIIVTDAGRKAAK